MRTIRRAWWFGTVLAIVMLGGCSMPGMVAARAVAAYVDADRRFTFSAPDGWMLDTASGTGALLSYTSAQPSGEFDVNVFDADGEDSLDLLVKATERALADSFDNYHVIDTTPENLGGENAQTIRYTATVGDMPLSFAQMLCLHNGAVYALTISASPDDIDRLAAQENVVLQSWMFL